VAWSPDAKLLAAGFGKGVIQVWTTETADLYRTIAVISDQPQQSLLFGDELEDFSKAVCSVEWLPDGQTIAAGTTNNSLTFWDVETGEQRQVQGVRVRTASGIEDASFISRSAIIHGRLQDEAIFTGAVSITYGETGTQDRKRAIGGYGRAVYSAFTTFGRQLLGATSPSRMLRLPLLRELIIRVPVSSLERSPDGSMLASASLLASIRLYDLPTIVERRRLRDRVGSVLGMAWSPDGKVLASAVLEGTVHLWDSGTGAQTQVLEGHTDAVVSVAFSYDGRLLASKALDNTVRIWRCDTWEPVAVLYEQVSGK
jgi:WD40 repeat protein